LDVCLRVRGLFLERVVLRRRDGQPLEALGELGGLKAAL
jgi:hypothetical protein